MHPSFGPEQSGTLAGLLAPTMSGTLTTLTPSGHGVLWLGGVIHWCGVPSLIHGELPPCRCSVARLSLKQPFAFGYSLHGWLRTSSITVPSFIGSIMSIGPMPDPMMVESTGRNRSPSTPAGSRL